jgi:hypothetical protein
MEKLDAEDKAKKGEEERIVAAKKQEWRRISNAKRRSAFAKGKRRKSRYVRMPRTRRG